VCIVLVDVSMPRLYFRRRGEVGERQTYRLHIAADTTDYRS
jgi:hypothetical protein